MSRSIRIPGTLKADVMRVALAAGEQQRETHADADFLYKVLFGLIATMAACGAIAAYLAWSGG